MTFFTLKIIYFKISFDLNQKKQKFNTRNMNAKN